MQYALLPTEAVAEALVTIYSRFGMPEAVLSDMGTQFTFECMQEVKRLLSVKHISASPYHPQCNGLTEKFNGTLKMLKRMCIEQPNEWHRYINPLLFAYRQVPQETTGFGPFELLFGRSIRGPIQILRELWSSAVALQLRALPKVSARAPAHRSYHFRGVKLKSCIKKIHHNLYINKQANVRIKHADTEGSSHKKFGTDARVQ